MVKYRIALMMLTVAIAVSLAAPVLADNDPSMHDVYVAAESGHLAQAQQMMTQVLRDHPRSAKAHYVAAEIYAKEGNLSLARVELNVAEQIEPGLPFAKPAAVQELKTQLGASVGGAGVMRVAPRPSVPWGMLLVGVAVIAGLWLLLRRRSVSGYASPPMGAGAPGYPGPVVGGGPGYGAPGYGPGYGPGAPGIGSGLAGGLASGLAVGAGVVAGEELAHHFLDGRRETVVPPAEVPSAQNPDMGGDDFGVSEDPGSWDDSGSSGGGDDWS